VRGGGPGSIEPARLLYCRDNDARADGQARVDRLGSYAELGLDRIVMFPSRWDTSDEGLASFAVDVRAAHLPLTGQLLGPVGG